MPTPFRTITREIAKRANAFKSASTGATADTDYSTSPLTATQVESPIWNLAFLQDVVADVHSDLANAIAAVSDRNGIGNHPWRVHFADVSASVTNGGNLPTVGATTGVIIGALGRPYDAVNTDQLMTMASAERVSAWVNNAGIYTNNPNMYHVNGTKVIHTTTNIVFPCCVYDRDDVAAIIAANGSFGTGAASGTIPDALTLALVAGGVAMAVVEDELIQQAGVYATYYQAVLQRIAEGGVVMPALPAGIGVAA